MGENFVCPYCDHVDNIQGECPDCGGTLTKFEDNLDDVGQEAQENDEFGLAPSESTISELDDFDEPEAEQEYHEGGLRVA